MLFDAYRATPHRHPSCKRRLQWRVFDLIRKRFSEASSGREQGWPLELGRYRDGGPRLAGLRLLQPDYLVDTPPEEEAPVEPLVPELLDVPSEPPADAPLSRDVELDEDPMPDEAPELDSMPPAEPDPLAPVEPEVPELLELPALSVEEAGELGLVVSLGPTLPEAEPPAEPMPEPEPEAEPDAEGPEAVQAARDNAHTKGKRIFFIRTPE